MEQKSLPPIWVFVGAGVVIVAVFGFLLSSFLAGGVRTTQIASPMPLATQPLAATEPVSQASTSSPPVPTPPTSELAAPLPTLASGQVPQIAPDFTLEQANGAPLTLSEQLTKGPVVLVLMQSGGG